MAALTTSEALRALSTRYSVLGRLGSSRSNVNSIMAWRGVCEVTDEMTEGQGQNVAVNLCWESGTVATTATEQDKACPCHAEEKSKEEMGLDVVTAVLGMLGQEHHTSYGS